MRAVGIDPGTACGYAWCDGNEPALHQSGVWDLSEGRHSGGGMRFLRLRQYLLELIQGSELVPLRAGYKPVCAVFYELTDGTTCYVYWTPGCTTTVPR